MGWKDQGDDCLTLPVPEEGCLPLGSSHPHCEASEVLEWHKSGGDGLLIPGLEIAVAIYTFRISA